MFFRHCVEGRVVCTTCCFCESVSSDSNVQSEAHENRQSPHRLGRLLVEENGRDLHNHSHRHGKQKRQPVCELSVSRLLLLIKGRGSLDRHCPALLPANKEPYQTNDYGERSKPSNLRPSRQYKPSTASRLLTTPPAIAPASTPEPLDPPESSPPPPPVPLPGSLGTVVFLDVRRSVEACVISSTHVADMRVTLFRPYAYPPSDSLSTLIVCVVLGLITRKY